MSICLGPDLPIRMAFTLRYIAVAVSVVLHAISGILLVSHTFFLSRTSPKPSFQSILAVVLQHFFPSLKELPPSFYFDHTPDSVDFSHQYRPRHRDSACSTHNTISGSASDDRSGPHLSISEPDKGYLHGHCASLQASQARARAARDPLFTLSSSLWTLKEYPTPYLLQGGDEHGSTNVPLIGFMTARRLPHLNFLRLHKRKGSRSRGNLASRSAPVLAMVIHFVFCRFIKEVLARSLPQRPDSQATHLHSITSRSSQPFTKIEQRKRSGPSSVLNFGSWCVGFSVRSDFGWVTIP